MLKLTIALGITYLLFAAGIAQVVSLVMSNLLLVGAAL